MMERTTTVSHRTTEDAKNNFNTAYATLLAKLLPEGINFTKEDFFEALLNNAVCIKKSHITEVIDGEPVKKS